MKRSSLKTRLLLGIITLTVSICILISVILGIILYQSSTSNMKSEVKAYGQGYALAVKNQINQYKLKIEAIATNDAITGGTGTKGSTFDVTTSTPAITQAKEELAKKYGFDLVGTADANGKGDVAGINVSDRDYFKEAISGKTYISSPVTSKKSGKVVLYVATKINNSTGFNGVVFAELSSDIFSSMVSNAKVGKTGYCFIVDKSGTIIAHQNQDTVTKFVNYISLAKQNSSYKDYASVVTSMINGDTGGKYYTSSGNQFYIAYQPIEGDEGWSIGVTAALSEMMSGYNSAILILVGVALAFILISVFVALAFAKPIVEPITNLVKRIEKLSEGDLHSPVPVVKSRNEIGLLSQTFSDTVNILNEYMGEMGEVLGKMSAGDLTAVIKQDYKGDFVAIKTALEQINGSLNQVFGEINQSAEQVSSGAEQVSAGAQALSQGATEQASSIEELSASISEIANEVNQNAKNAANASKLSQEASNEVEKGDQHMQQMITAMADISDSSNQIEKIIKTIEDIAFQTNILALNAAVEAARAGAAGKGFAVVADEVRNLASKSAEAAKNTTALIEGSITAVDKGKKIAGETEKSLGDIIKCVQNTNTLIEQISSASNEQATSINQVTQGIDQISAVVQTNSATAEESAATSEELSGQAQMLKNMLASLKLKNN